MLDITMAEAVRSLVIALTLGFCATSEGETQAIPPGQDRAEPAQSHREGTIARRIGNWEISRWPGLAVVADQAADVIHLVYRDDNRLFYTRSADGGQHWSESALIVESGMHPRLALDREQTLHLVYCTGRDRFQGDRMPKDAWYMSLSDRQWTPPIQLNRPEEGAFEVRIAVDGADNLHFLYWGMLTAGGALGDHDNHRSFYRRKPAGNAGIEEPLCLQNPEAPGPSSYGALAVGPEGEVHVLYRTYQTSPVWTGNIEHRVRGKDGVWRGVPEVHRGVYVADYSLSGLMDAEGTLHLACYTFRPHEFKFKCFRKRPGGALEEIFAEDEIYGTSTDIMQAPDGDLWLAGSGNWSTRSRVGLPRSSCYRYDAAKKDWEKQFLSPSEAVNVDVFCEGLRLLLYRDEVHLFYAEKNGGDDRFRLYQKNSGDGVTNE